MAQIILDCDLMRYPNSGLYYYCLNLGLHVNRLLELQQDTPAKMYIPRNAFPAFGAVDAHIIESKWHKYRYFRPFLNDCRVWHATFQSGRIVPDKRKYKNINVLLTVHDLNFLHEGKLFKEQKKSLAHVQSLIDKSEAIVCVSEFTKNDVLTHCNVKGKPVSVVHNGIYIDTALKTAPNLYIPARPFLFAMGYVNSKKNYHVLISLLADNPDLELVIAGKLDDANYIAGMLQKATKIRVHDRLHVIGPISDEDKTWYMHHCEAFMHPSLAEGFGIPVLEAMAFGKPVFLSDRTSLPEIAGQLGFYFRSFERDEMNHVFTEGMKQYREQPLLKQALIDRANKFNWEKSAAEYINIYKSMC